MADSAAQSSFNVVAPLRVDLAGSWCDCPQYTDLSDDAATLSLAVLPGAKCVVRSGAGATRLTLASPAGLPVGSGLGCSAALSVAHVAAVRRGAERSLPEGGARAEIAEAAFLYEGALSGQLTGRQDHYAAAFGGLRLYLWGLTSGEPHVDAESVAYEAGVAEWLADRLSVFYTGRRRLSGRVHESMWAELTDARLATLRALADGARSAARAIGAADEAALGAQMDEQRRRIEALCPAAAVPHLDHLADVLGQEAALGAKALGAGGGGCVAVLHPAEAREHVRRDVSAAFGWSVWPFRPAPEGVTFAQSESETE